MSFNGRHLQPGAALDQSSGGRVAATCDALRSLTFCVRLRERAFGLARAPLTQQLAALLIIFRGAGTPPALPPPALQLH